MVLDRDPTCPVRVPDGFGETVVRLPTGSGPFVPVDRGDEQTVLL